MVIEILLTEKSLRVPYLIAALPRVKLAYSLLGVRTGVTVAPMQPMAGTLRPKSL